MSPPRLQFRDGDLLSSLVSSPRLLKQGERFLGINDSGPERHRHTEDHKVSVDGTEPEEVEDICFVVERLDESDQDEYRQKNGENGQVKQEALEHDDFHVPHHEVLNISQSEPSLPGHQRVDAGEETAGQRVEEYWSVELIYHCLH